ncbi:MULTISPECIES: ABC transporter ATP-binding protein [Actibacterium]|jgi:ATP-binding cassette, subfamily B, bacterial MsbA|uniref:ABC-type multidrug transport system fused ATPase/permease subunit n=1 Tax=Actibacterium naphthalenivorans TaxID=1614693 RepID=A0A840CAF1_9RHOB|nr:MULTISPECIES: ABC transporter ATP-binding protein [Actibacterium]ALG90811.1 ABC transporter ATP-binding protein [Actibacterium sp. EMB200-NS6]MBB4022971.1 ABC-type multidrug transport system fused ATPase/permease subunit [Actibacterium naphthalenivorans]
MAERAADGDPRPLVSWIWRGYLKRHLPVILAALVLMTLEGGMLGALSYMIEPMFDEVFVSGNKAALGWVAGGIFAVFLARALSGFGQRVLMARVGQKVAAALQGDMVAHMLTLDSQWFQKTPPGNLIERVRGDTTAASTIWSTVLAAAGRDVVALISLFAVALSIDWLWTLIAVAGAPLLVLPIIGLQRWVRRTARSARAAAAAIATRLDEIFHGVTTIKLNRMERRESGRFADTLDGFVSAQIRSQIGQAGIPALIDIVAGIGFFGVLTYGGLQIIDGQKTVGEFMSFFTAMALVFEPLRRIGNVSGAWQQALASLERLYDVFDARPTILPPARPRPLPCPPQQADITLRDVHMAYEDTPVLNGLSLTAKAGQVTALVGASGAGKSTVFNLLARLVEPQSGQITVGSLPIHDMALPDLRGLFSVVTQDAMLFDETLRDNILLGRTDITETRLNEVLQAAHIADFLPNLPNGLDSPAGPRGSSLSGGQRQRVAIARALLRDAPILLLDEATSALDAKSERVVQDALDRLSTGRTTLVIAHRLATVRNADQIVVMDKGRVAEQGTHDELLARGGLYSGLYKLQFATTD